MTTMQTIHDMEEHLRVLRARQEEIRAELAGLEATIEGGRRFLKSLSDALGIQSTNGISVGDLVGCKTIHEGLVRYAELNGGLVNVREAGFLLFDAGRIQGQRENAPPTVHRTLNMHGEDWVKMEPGVFKHIPYIVKEAEAEEALAQGKLVGDNNETFPEVA